MIWSVYLVGLVAAALPVEATSLTGGTISGQLQELTAESLTIQPESGETRKLPTGDLLELRITGITSTSNPERPVGRVQLTDGTVLQLEELQTTAKELRGKHALLGEIMLPMPAVQSIRFVAPSAKFDPLWNQLLDKNTRQDMIVLQKPEVLDHLDGVVGAVEGEKIKFLLDGDEISVKREKAYGLIYARKPSNAKLAAKVQLANGDLIAVKSATSDGADWQLTTVVGPKFSLSATGVAALDYSLGKVVYLSTLEPRNVKYTPYESINGEGEFYWKFRRDRSVEGKPLRLNQKTYARGLAIHSKTELRYRLGGEYRRLQAMVGIDDEITKFGATTVRIIGDRKPLYAADFAPRQPAVPLDLDVTGVIELEILVDWGPDGSDIGDRIHLADARLVK